MVYLYQMVVLVGGLRKICSQEILSLSVGISGSLFTAQNTALTLFNMFGFEKGGVLMVGTLLVVGALGATNDLRETDLTQLTG